MTLCNLYINFVNSLRLVILIIAHHFTIFHSYEFYLAVTFEPLKRVVSVMTQSPAIIVRVSDNPRSESGAVNWRRGKWEALCGNLFKIAQSFPSILRNHLIRLFARRRENELRARSGFNSRSFGAPTTTGDGVQIATLEAPTRRHCLCHWRVKRRLKANKGTNRIRVTVVRSELVAFNSRTRARRE